MITSSRTLEQLEGKDWGEPTYDSYLVRTIHALRRKPLAELNIEDLRIMLGQEVGTEYLLPIALDHLEVDPYVEGDYYPGDLLSMVMKLPREYWTAHPTEAWRMITVANVAASLLDAPDVTEEIKANLRTLISAQAWRAV